MSRGQFIVLTRVAKAIERVHIIIDISKIVVIQPITENN